MNYEEFLSLVHSDCDYHGVRIIRSEKDSVSFGDGTTCNGYFDDGSDSSNPPTLAYSTGKPFGQWFPVLVHEYNHMRQWIEGDPLWSSDPEEDELIWEWISGKTELTKAQAKKHVMSSLNLELDCERRTYRMIKELSLPFDAERYAKKGNAYVYFYHMVLKHRRWYTIGEEPYNILGIVRRMPKTFRGNYTKISPKLVKLYEKHLGWQG